MCICHKSFVWFFIKNIQNIYYRFIKVWNKINMNLMWIVLYLYKQLNIIRLLTGVEGNMYFVRTRKRKCMRRYGRRQQFWYGCDETNVALKLDFSKKLFCLTPLIQCVFTIRKQTIKKCLIPEGVLEIIWQYVSWIVSTHNEMTP